MALIIIIIGVSGAGKTTVGRRLATELAWPFFEGDDFHPPENLAKMGQGIPLTDGDRQPWLESLRNLIADLDQKQQSAVISCSALKQAYRDLLRGDDRPVKFVYLAAEPDTLRDRLRQRPDHFMPESLLESQLETLEKPEAALQIDAEQPVDDILRQIRQWID